MKRIQKARFLLILLVTVFLLEINHMLCSMYDNGPEWFKEWNWIDVQFTVGGQLIVWQVQILNCVVIFMVLIIACLMLLVLLEDRG